MTKNVVCDVAIPRASGDIHAILVRPPAARWLFVLAHGAGAGMRHHFMEDVAQRLAARDIATLRYEFPYMSAGSRRPDPAPRLEAAVRTAVEWAAAAEPALRIAAGGKSMGGRMTSRAQAAAPLERVETLVFLGFPLHNAKEPDTKRADHLADVHVPMLFLQGDRDALAFLPLITDVTSVLGERAHMHVCTGADHAFEVLKRSGRTNDEVLDELADTIAGWLDRLPQAPAAPITPAAP